MKLYYFTVFSVSIKVRQIKRVEDRNPTTLETIMEYYILIPASINNNKPEISLYKRLNITSLISV